MSNKTTSLSKHAYRIDIPGTLRSIADNIENGLYPNLEDVTLTLTEKDGQVESFSMSKDEAVKTLYRNKP